jgi:hypothetical protein
MECPTLSCSISVILKSTLSDFKSHQSEIENTVKREINEIKMKIDKSSLSEIILLFWSVFRGIGLVNLSAFHPKPVFVSVSEVGLL